MTNPQWNTWYAQLAPGEGSSEDERTIRGTGELQDVQTRWRIVSMKLGYSLYQCQLARTVKHQVTYVSLNHFGSKYFLIATLVQPFCQ